MKFVLFITLIIFGFSSTVYSQDFINCSKEYLITKLKKNGFEANPAAHYYIKDSSNQVLALFNEFRYSRIEYHISNHICDSISCSSTCDQCFDGTLNSILSQKKRKWKKQTENIFVSLRKPQASTIKGAKLKTYFVLKLEITSSKANGTLSFLMYNQEIRKAEYLQLKKAKRYKGTINSY